ncbi:uncharacterized protein TEOVI_000103600 [Trypanosoma equiperdum]|uniref:Uncharacterized protein n=2 Tax=Trypanozoon TaxID=39700 RepID=Q386F7_TRYB2|nr:hypothetical protein, conserved [Trypanosoma brucei brucei TREU927]EAN79324.1 hypothetical protein, conserved [Trypanosoma brucei brucei TREU927]SCU69470.1 hypothetical protein, conserved [Trypanosoma equiperdum]
MSVPRLRVPDQNDEQSSAKHFPADDCPAKSSSVRTTAANGQSTAQSINVSARFLPYDDICGIGPTLHSSPTEENEMNWSHEHGANRFLSDRETHGTRRLCFTGGSSGGGTLSESQETTASEFVMELRDALKQTMAEGNSPTDLEVDGSAGPAIWMRLFERWPLELAASGYAEWWLRHPKCGEDASQLFQMFIDGIAREECRRNPLDGEKDGEELRDGVLQGALVMLQALYADPPQSLRAAFGTPLYHQQLFFRTCRLGALGDGRELALCLSLAAAIAQRIAGNKLAMRHDLSRFIGRVRRNWQALREKWSDEEKLVLEVGKVEALLAFALD